MLALTVSFAIANTIAVCAALSIPANNEQPHGRADRRTCVLSAAALAIPLCLVALFHLLRAQEAGLFYSMQYYTLNAFAAAIAVRDVREGVIPNKWLGCMAGAWVLTLVPRITGGMGAAHLAGSALGAALGGGLFLAAFALARGGLGAGDVKFMTVIGLYVGFRGVVPSMFFALAAASLAGLGLAAVRKTGMKTRLPLAPFMWFGACLSLLLL